MGLTKNNWLDWYFFQNMALQKTVLFSRIRWKFAIITIIFRWHFSYQRVKYQAWFWHKLWFCMFITAFYIATKLIFVSFFNGGQVQPDCHPLKRGGPEKLFSWPIKLVYRCPCFQFSHILFHIEMQLKTSIEHLENLIIPWKIGKTPVFRGLAIFAPSLNFFKGMWSSTYFSIFL